MFPVALIPRKLRQAARKRAATAANKIAQVELTGKFSVGCVSARAKLDDQLDFIHDITGLGLPEEANTFRENENFVCCWLGPDEWLFISDADKEKELAERLQAEIDKRKLHAAVTAVGGAYVMLKLSGPKASEVLAKGCSLDLHLRSFVAGRCARSQLAKASVLLRRPFSAPGNHNWEIIVRRSFSEYLCLWLLDAGEEFGLRANF